MAYDNTNSGAMFENDKRGNPKAPDRKGKLNVNGHEYEIAGWIRISKKGQKYLQLKVSEPRARGRGEERQDAGEEPNW